MAVEVIVNGNTYSADGRSTGRDMVGADGYGHTRWLLPMLLDNITEIGARQTTIAEAVATALGHRDAAAGSATTATAAVAGIADLAAAAAGSAGEAASSVGMAQAWATKTDGTVSDGEYSAKHHAQQASIAAQAAAEVAASLDGAPVASINGKTGIVSLVAADVGAEPALTPAAAAEMQAGTVTERRAMSPADVRTAIETLAPMPAPVRRPVNASPAAGATGIGRATTLTAGGYFSLYGIAQSGARFQLSATADFAAPAYDSGQLAAVSSHAVPAGIMATSTQYWWRAQYKDADGAWSEWSEPTSFNTAAVFNDYIATPAATPSNFGDALEGGFYAGMVWNELTQSSSSKALATGAQSFAVADMVSAPIVYAGQMLEVRSRANPTNKFIGTVTSAAGTTLTLNVTSIGGSGTFSDWSVMARYRVIVAPKASGENASAMLKNANSALPAACQTLTEGWKSTEAMRTADTSTVYPAAHWARSLSINGRSDWYVPARDELELLWRNLKPVTNSNYVTADRPTAASFNYANNGSYGDTANTHGVNNNSSPAGAAYSASVPGQTAATAFRSGGAEAFEFGTFYYWSSSDYSASNAWFQYWNSSSPGYQDNGNKANTLRVRAVRRSII